MMIVQSPSTLAQLPKPLGLSDNQIRCSQVYGVDGSSRRRRHELAVAVDGEAINIYNAQSGKLRTSYALPPQATLSCDPCSIRYKISKRGQSVRKTYCAFNSPETEVWCFTEEEDPVGDVRFSTSRYVLDDQENTVVFIESLSTVNPSREPEYDLLLVQQDGHIRRLSGDLVRHIWSTEISYASSTGGSQQVLAATLTSDEEATHGSLRNRPDIMAIVGSNTLTDGANSIFLMLVMRTTRKVEAGTSADITFQTHLIPDASTTKISAHNTLSEPLLQTTFPKDSDQWGRTANAEISIQGRKGTVTVAFEKGMIIYDVGGYSVDVRAELIPDTEVFSSLIQLSSGVIAGASTSSVAVYDVKHHSVLDRLPLDQDLVNRKRKRTTGQSMEEPVKLIAFFSRLATIIARRGNALLSFDLGERSTLGRKDSRRRADGMLIDAIGRGMVSTKSKQMKQPKNTGPGFGHAELSQNQEAIDHWRSQKSQLDSLWQARKFEEFEEELAKVIFNSPGEELSHLDLFDRSTTTPASTEMILYAVSRTFTSPQQVGLEAANTVDDGLSLNTETPHLLQWLIRSGLLSRSFIAKALSNESPSGTPVPIPAGRVTQAFADADSSLQLLTRLVTESRDLEATELFFVVQTNMIDALSSRQPRKIELNETDDGGDIRMLHADTSTLPNGDVHDSTYVIKQAYSTNELESGSVETGSVHRFLVLSALKKLHAQSRGTLLSAMRSQLDGNSVLALIQFLRQQLFEGGYTTSFRAQSLIPSSPMTLTISSDRNRKADVAGMSLENIIGILSVCVDTLGASLLLSTSPENNYVQTLFEDLRSEISSALEGVEEATYLKGILREVWRYAESGANVKDSSLKKAAEDGQHRAGEIITLYSQPSEEQSEHATSGGMMPLSLKMETGISDYKVRRGGGGEEVRRTGREKAGLEHRAVGRYSFDRLRF